MKNAQGFTLIELMIVVAIVGILAAIAIPAYSDYTIRARVTEALAFSAAAKTTISEYYASEGEMPTNAAVAGLAVGTANIPAGGHISQLAYTRSNSTNGVYAVTLRNLGVTLPGITFTGTGSTSGVSWVCAKTGSLKDRQVPTNCR